jgi:hypothetical protein
VIVRVAGMPDCPTLTGATPKFGVSETPTPAWAAGALKTRVDATMTPAARSPNVRL